jgi:4-hydroxythreonine-4-phosphate dehydrogenase
VVTRPRLAITLGDPRGIGPEVTRLALQDPEIRAIADFVVVGPEGPLAAFHGGEGASLQAFPVGRWTPGDPVAAAGHVAGLSVARAVEAALNREVEAVVTAPIEKAAFRAGGWLFPGHTEMLRELTGAPAVGMMMAAERTQGGGPLRVVLATIHIPLREVPDALTVAGVVEQSRLAADALRRWWRISEPRIALCAVNPHASDGGLFGDEEARILEPAVRLLRSEGILAAGPFPADTVFTRAIRGETDAVVAPYHDVGMAAFKTASFGAGVNVTLGLPFPRTSPDHGTALDIAGRGTADPSSMKEAIRLAAHLVRAGRVQGFDSPGEAG